MTHIIFYEKPNCGGNARQRQALLAAGHTLERRDLLKSSWSANELLGFLDPLPIAQWFNRASPRVKSGEIVPENLDVITALQLLLADHLLIRRPLMQWIDLQGKVARMVGFDTAHVNERLGLHPSKDAPASLEGCVHEEPSSKD